MYITSINYHENIQNKQNMKINNFVTFQAKYPFQSGNTTPHLDITGFLRDLLKKVAACTLAAMGLNKFISDNNVSTQKKDSSSANGTSKNLKLYKVANFRKTHNWNKYNYKIAEKINNDNELKKIYYNEADAWLYQIVTEEEYKIVDKILSEPRLYKNCDSYIISNILEKMKNSSENQYNETQEQKLQSIIKVLDFILSKDTLANSDDFIHNIMWDDISSIHTHIQPEPQIKIMNKILSDEKLHKYFIQKLCRCFIAYTTNDNVEYKLKMIDKILSNKNLFNNDAFMMKSASILIDKINNQDDLDCAFILLDKILSDIRLYGSDDFMQNSYLLIDTKNTKEDFQKKLELINMILLNNDLCNNDKFMKKAPDIFDAVKTNEQFELAKQLLSKKELFLNKVFWDGARSIILESHFYDNEKASNDAHNVLDNFIQNIISDKRLYNNETFISKVDDILKGVKKYPELAKNIMGFIEKLPPDVKGLDTPDAVASFAEYLKAAFEQG